MKRCIGTQTQKLFKTIYQILGVENILNEKQCKYLFIIIYYRLISAKRRRKEEKNLEPSCKKNK